jgi:pyruvate-formate lyase
MEKQENQNYVQLLIQTLEKQEATLQQVLQITQQQSELADDKDFDELMLENSLNQKDMLITKLNELDDGFATVYGRVRNIIMKNQSAYRNEIEQMQGYIKRCTDLGVEIKVLEERNRDKLAQCFSGKYKQYSARQTAATVASKYHRTMHPGVTSGSRFSK